MRCGKADLERSDSLKKKILFLSILILSTCLAFSENSTLEFQSIVRIDADGKLINDDKVKPGSELMTEMKYVRRGFPEESQTIFYIELYDAQGHCLLKDEQKKPALEGGRRDRYKLNIPPDASGHYLIVFTVKVLSEGKVLSQVSKNFPFVVV